MAKMMIKIEALPALKDNYIWILSFDGKALVIDPGVGAPVINYLNLANLELVMILATHKHWDHTDGILPLIEAFPGVPVYGPFKDQVPFAEHDVSEGQIIEVAPFSPIKVLEIPGHTRGHVAYLIENHLFCGDTLFLGGCGRVFDGTYEELFASLQKMAALPENTQIYCAHEYTLANLHFALKVEPENRVLQERFKDCEALRRAEKITVPQYLSLERATNPFLRFNMPEVKQSAERYVGHSLESDFEVFKALRVWKNNA